VGEQREDRDRGELESREGDKVLVLGEELVDVAVLGNELGAVLGL
jgi:hypothetical protein